MNYKLLNFNIHGDNRGKLISLENMKTIPFEIKRIYYMFDTLPNEARGFHAHRDLEQIIIAMDGACRFILDDGERREQVLLNRPDVGLYIGKNMWREMHDFSYGCKLVVLASEYYDEKEYIRNYDDFLKSLRKRSNYIMNENAFFDDLLLGFLYKKKSISTNEIEEKFGDVLDWQNVNNVISNRYNTPSYINKGLMNYDENVQVLSITKAGEDFIRNKYSKKRK